MDASAGRRQARIKRQTRVRQKVRGTEQRPRLCVFRSAKHMYAQIIEDTTGKTLLSVSTISKDVAGDVKYPGNVEAAKAVGEAIAKKALEQKIKQVVLIATDFCTTVV